jgi:ABC-2 type transport system ATP-binding protein
MPTSHPPAIQIVGLRKSFKDNHVLRGIDLDIPSGIVFALLGANGAGKTTAINILTTLLPRRWHRSRRRPRRRHRSG